MGQLCCCIKPAPEIETVDGRAAGNVKVIISQLEIVQTCLFLLQLGNEVSFEELQQIARKDNAFRCGSTNDPNRRKNEYSSREGFTGTMYSARVSNMKQAEDVLLEIKDWPKNKQTKSNIRPKEGYVYVII